MEWDDGTTVTGVKVLQPPEMRNGVEIAELNLSFDGGTIWHEHLMLLPANGSFSAYTMKLIQGIGL